MAMRTVTGFLISLAMLQPALSQQQRVSTLEFETALAYYRPRIAVADDGAYTVAWEVLRKLDLTESWHLAVQQYRADGLPLETAQFVEPDSVCPDDADQRDIQNAEIAYTGPGELVVSMNQLASVYAREESVEPVVGLAYFNDRGERMRDVSRAYCVPAHSEEARIVHVSRAQFLLAPGGLRDPVGFVPIEAFSSASERDAEIRPGSHISDRPKSSGYVGGHDAASNTTITAAVWHECPAGPEGDADACDVMVQFFEHESAFKLVPSGPAVRVNQNDAGDVLNYRPSVAMNERGESMVVWVDYRTGEQGEVFGQRFDAQGRPQGENMMISMGEGTISDADAIRPEVALLDQGEALVVWTDRDPQGQHAKGRRFEAGGKASGPPFLLDASPATESGFPDIASNGTEFVYTWMAEHDGVPSIFSNKPSLEADGYNRLREALQALTLKSYPNPFSNATTLVYSLEAAGHVTLVIYDLLGRAVKTLVDQPQGPGSYQVTVNGDELAMGYYITELQLGENRQTRLLIHAE